MTSCRALIEPGSAAWQAMPYHTQEGGKAAGIIICHC